MAYVMGIDIGSAYSKGLVKRQGAVEGSVILPSRGDYRKTADTIRERLLSMADLQERDIAYSIATGYGAKNVGFAQDVVTDITFSARPFASTREGVSSTFC